MKYLLYISVVCQALLLAGCNLDKPTNAVNQDPPPPQSGIPFTICVTAQQASALWPHGAKLVFVNRDVSSGTNTLVNIEFSTGQISFVESQTIASAYFPSFSPDGSRIAYSTGVWADAVSTVYICKSEHPDSTMEKLSAAPAFAPTWWVDPQNLDTCIVYTNSVVINELSLWSSTKTFLHRPGSSPQAVDMELCSKGSFYGGYSADGKYIATGYTQFRVYDVARDSIFQLFIYPEHGKESDGSTQACNLSFISPNSGIAKALFLDFGSTTTSNITGTRYSMHDYIFVCQVPDGKVVQWFQCPAGEDEWQNSKWSNTPDYAVACVLNQAIGRHAIYAVNTKDSSYTRLVEGVELWQPALWVRE